MTKILIDRSVVEQVLKALNTGMPIHKRSPTYRALQAALDAKPDEEVEINGLTKAETDASMSVRGLSKPQEQDDLVQRLRLGSSISRDRNLNLDFAKIADEAAARIEALTAENNGLRSGKPLGALVGAATIIDQAQRINRLEKALELIASAENSALDLAYCKGVARAAFGKELRHD